MNTHTKHKNVCNIRSVHSNKSHIYSLFVVGGSDNERFVWMLVEEPHPPENSPKLYKKNPSNDCRLPVSKYTYHCVLNARLSK